MSHSQNELSSLTPQLTLINLAERVFKMGKVGSDNMVGS